MTRLKTNIDMSLNTISLSNNCCYPSLDTNPMLEAGLVIP